MAPAGTLSDARAFGQPAMARACHWVIAFVRKEMLSLRDDLVQVNRTCSNEPALTEVVVLHLAGHVCESDGSFIFKAESREDRARGTSAAVDIGVYWRLPGRSAAKWPRVTTIEAKRLDSSLPARRRREYVVGHEKGGRYVPCGGMERYKMGIHGRDVGHVVMLLGYVQSDDFSIWRKRINSWIVELADEEGHEPSWSDKEQLGEYNATDGVATSESIVRRSKDKLRLVHLWVDLVDDRSGDSDA